MDQRVKSVLKFVRNEVSLHINGANLKSNVTLPQRPAGSSFIQINLSPTYRLQPSLRVLTRVSAKFACHRDRLYMSVMCPG